MFKLSENDQLDLFGSPLSQLCKLSSNKLEDQTAWNQVFWHRFVSKIDERPYEALYISGRGRPNASIRVLIGMMVIKEFNGWTDDQLFDECMFNLRVRAALGIMDISAVTPVSSTYYLFRSKLAKHHLEYGVDLIEQTFNEVCMEQIKYLNISGQKIRMDSKLIQSNLARSTRVELLVEALRIGVRSINEADLLPDLSEEQGKLVTLLTEQSTSNIVYPLDKAEQTSLIEDIGHIITTMIRLDMVPSGTTLHTVYKQQYEYVTAQDEDLDSPPKLRPKLGKDIPSDSIQSVHDTEASYRRKGKGEHVQKVKGYHCNITETCGEAGKPNIITDVITTPAHISESDYLQDAIASSEQKLCEGATIEVVITDGGYDSNANQKAISETKGIAWKMHKLKGPKRVYEMTYNDEGALMVKSKKTGEQLEVTWLEQRKRYRIKNSNGSYRYLTSDEVSTYIQRLAILEDSSTEDYNLRSSVESTIHEVFHRLWRRQKIRYRGIIKCHWYTLSRALSVNLGRVGRSLKDKASTFIDLLLQYFLSHHINLTTRWTLIVAPF